MSEPVATRTLLVANRMGMHARPATLIAKLAQEFDATVEIVKGHERVSARDVLQLLMLGAAQGESLRLEASGPQSQQALDAMEQLFERRFDED
jgi:phosphotransferase system HPr (HPr) family protein